jgi:hypothetical protein
MSDHLDRLAARYATEAPARNLCPACGERETEARVVVQVRRIKPDPGKKVGSTVVNRVRSVCGQCAASIFGNVVEHLPAVQAGPGGRPL